MLITKQKTYVQLCWVINLTCISFCRRVSHMNDHEWDMKHPQRSGVKERRNSSSSNSSQRSSTSRQAKKTKNQSTEPDVISHQMDDKVISMSHILHPLHSTTSKFFVWRKFMIPNSQTFHLDFPLPLNIISLMIWMLLGAFLNRSLAVDAQYIETKLYICNVKCWQTSSSTCTW